MRAAALGVVAVVLAAMVFVSSEGVARGGEDSAGRSEPNIVFILADDLGCGDVGCYGCDDIRTPNLDRLAREGVRFTNFYANAPECTPTRTALMTGRYQQRVGGLECAIGTGNVGRYDDAVRLADAGQLGLPAEQNVLVGGLGRAGYACAAFGKWHLGYEAHFAPRRHGFAEFLGPLGGGVDYFFHVEPDGTPMLYRDEQRVDRDGYLTDLITEAAVAFLDRRRGDPFFLYVPYTAPHTPIQAPGPRPAAPRTDADWNDGDRPTYAAMVERMDEGIGKILDALRRRGLENDTLLVFASDNGGTKLGRNAPFSGYKGGLMEGGIRVPCVVRWPGVLPKGAVTAQPAITMDLTRSFLRVAGTEPPEHLPPDGIDVLRWIEERSPVQARTLFWRQRRGERTWRAVRNGDVKYVSQQDGEQLVEHLFDLDRDPAETHDLAADRPAEVDRLKRLVRAWEEDVQPSR